MKAFLAACLACAVIAVAAWATLHQLGFSSADVTTSPSVRLD